MGQHTFAISKANSQGLSLGLALANIGGSIPYPAAVTSNIGAELHVGNNCHAVNKPFILTVMARVCTSQNIHLL